MIAIAAALISDDLSCPPLDDGEVGDETVKDKGIGLECKLSGDRIGS